VAVDVDFESRVQGASARLKLVNAVLEANDSDETDCLEWKVQLPLGKAEGNFEVARQVLGFANRDSVEAAGSFGGYAYLLVGVEPQTLRGIELIDPADLDKWISRYVGPDGPRWDAHFVALEATYVLVIEVAPPSAGDRVHTLEKGFDTFEAGAIFVRHMGRTTRATAGDIWRLVDRAAVSTQRVEIDVVPATDGTLSIAPLDLSDESVDAYIQAERARLLSPLNQTRPLPPINALLGGSSVRAFQDSILAVQRIGWNKEKREPDEYRGEVDNYLDQLSRALTAVAVSMAVRRSLSLISLKVRNLTDKNFHGVEVRLQIDGEVFSAHDEDPADPDPELPSAPTLWGTLTPPDWMSGMISPMRMPFVSGLSKTTRSAFRRPHNWVCRPERNRWPVKPLGSASGLGRQSGALSGLIPLSIACSSSIARTTASCQAESVRVQSLRRDTLAA
jgi:hypothetical protein